MGCFPACFTSSKRRKSLKSRSEDQVLQTSGAIELSEQTVREESVENLISLIRESSKGEFEDQVNFGAKKRVTFDLDLNEANDESFAKKEATCHSGEKTSEEEEPLKANYRYQNCRKSVDEYEDTGLEVSDLEEKDANDEQESSESLFSLSIDSRKQACDIEKGEKEVTSPISVQSSAMGEATTKESCRSAGKRCRFVESVLNPIENLSQWNEVKQKRPISQQVQLQDKENVISESENHSLKPKLSKTKLEQQDIRVDTSLSSWLLGSEGSLKSDGESEVVNSAMRPRNGKVLEDYCRGLSSSTRSRSEICDTASPLIGTVGSYWVHTGQDIAMDSSPHTRNVI